MGHGPQGRHAPAARDGDGIAVDVDVAARGRGRGGGIGSSTRRRAVDAGRMRWPSRRAGRRRRRRGDNPRGTAAAGSGGTEDNDAGQEGGAAKEYDAAGTYRNGGGVCVCVWPPVKDELLLSMRFQSLVLTSMTSPPYPRPQ